jgi:xanthine/uracil permease
MVYGVMGSFVVTIGGALYNVAARWAGGLKVGIDVADDPSS